MTAMVKKDILLEEDIRGATEKDELLEEKINAINYLKQIAGESKKKLKKMPSAT
jgi:hypothetical protein